MSARVRLAMLRATGAALRAGRRAALPASSSPRLLLIRPDHIGDVVLTSPAVELLRSAFPESHITMMVGPWSEQVARRDPMLDEVLSFPFPGFTRSPKGSVFAPYQVLLVVASILRRGEYDVAMILRDDHWWGALAAALAQIPVVVGYGIAECLPFLTHALPPDPRLHWTERAIRLASLSARVLGKETGAIDGCLLRFGVRDEDEAEADRIWETLALNAGSKVVAMHPGSGAALKLWPEENWVDLGNRFASRGLAVVLTGSRDEAEMAGRIAAGIAGSNSLAGLVGLGTLAAVLRRCSLVVGTDSGPLHMAAAVDTSSVRLYGPTDPAVYSPWGDPRRHVAVRATGDWRPCGRLDLAPADGKSPACMRAISVDHVESACRQLL